MMPGPIKKGGKPKYGRAGEYQSKRPIGGPGLFVSCVRGKESRCVGEVMDMLEMYADELYPTERLAAYAALPPAPVIVRGRTTTDDQPVPSIDLAALSLADALSVSTSDMEGVSSAAPPAPASEDSDEEDFVDESIEDSIARELIALKAARTAGRRNINERGERDGASETTVPREKRTRPRFMSLQTGIECLIFIAFEKPYDPLEITLAIVADLRKTGISHTRYTNRLQPVVSTCHSLSADEVDLISRQLIEQVTRMWLESNQALHVTFSIEPSIRCHTVPHSRATLVQSLGDAIINLAITSSSSSLPFTTGVHLTAPDLVILPIVYKNFYGITLVEGKLWSGKAKRFNLDAIGMEARREIAEAKGETFVRGTNGREVKADDLARTPMEES